MDTIKITPPAGSPIEITPLSESYARTALQEIDTLVLHYELPEHTDLPLGSTASFRGTTYTLYKTSDLTMHHSRAYEYTATLYGDGERTRLYKVANLVDGRLSFTLTAKPHEHLQMLVDTLNKREGAGTWTAGSVPDGTEITIAYDHISVLDALVQLATKLETEWGITGTTLHIGKLTNSSEPLSLRYGRGKGILPDIRRTPVDDYPIGRLYANGGSRNIDPSTYGSKTLHFPKGATETYDGQVYHTDPTGTYVYPEGDAATSSDTSIDLTHIYPSRIGGVTKVEVTKDGAVDILDSTISETLDYEKQLLEGQTLTVKFETGMLAGREPFGAKYIHRDRRFQIVPRDEDGVTLPGGVYLPKEGDKYTVFGCSLPLQYISDAETAMLSEAVKYLHSHQTEQYNITIELDGIYTKQHWGEIGSRLALGHRVRFTDPSWQPTPVDIRILGITTYLSRPYSPKLDLSNSPLPSSFTAVIKRVEGDQLVREEEYRGGLRRLEKRTYEDAKATREMIERLRVEGFTHSITPETLRTLQAVIGSPALQFAFSTSDGKRVLPLAYSWEKGHTELHLPGGQYILRGGNGSTLSPASEGKVVPMAEYTYSLKDEETQLYLYADLTSKSYKVSATPMEITDTRLLVALIHGMGDSRTLTPLYGFTEITPGQLKTDLIRSQDGKSYWDLLSGTFATTGDLLIGDPKGNTCLAYIDGVLYVKGLTVNVGSASTTIEDALLEQERKIDDAKKVRQPIIKNGTWWVWDDTTNQLIDSGKPAQGESGHSFTASLRVEGLLEDGRAGVFYLKPTFVFDGKEIDAEGNFACRYRTNNKLSPGNGIEWSDWENWNYELQGEIDISEDYSGPGIDFEVSNTYNGYTAVAHSFFPHSISPEKLKSITDGLQSATTVIKSLQEAQDAIDRKMISEEQLSSMKYLLDAIKYGDFGNLGGLLLAQVLALSNRDKKVTSYMSGFDGKGQHMLAAGVTGFGTSNERADVYLDHDGDFYLSKDDTFLKFDPQGRFALTLFGGKLNIPGVLYAGYFTETNLRSLGGPCKADYSFGQLAVLAKSRYGGAVLLEDVSPNSFYFDQGYEQAWRVDHYAGTKNYVPVVVGGLQTAIQILEEDYFEFVIQTQPQPRPKGSIYILILGENRANYD